MLNGLVEQLRESIGRNDLPGEYGTLNYRGASIFVKRYDGKSPARRAKNEFKIGRYLHRGSVNVPEMYRLVAPDFPLIRHFKTAPIEHWYLLMENINGKSIRTLRKEGRVSELEEAARQCKVELYKTFRLNVFVADLKGDSVLFDSQGRTYLVDFEHWMKVKTTKEHYEWLDRLDPSTLW